ncbi:sodium- and chloride-dependent glycine transporter 2-like protein [Leptotrombidium deliense]|uniref:Transporter n=1 Tax=Leptotrombidium deliense TaxID=299467 RepID=A0A443SS84_9ACAR|nr:sodium- and chloride-dependent glycine transporter 2-like protein [Leptotrombidium deliense]
MLKSTISESVENACEAVNKKQPKKRGNWAGKYDFILSMIGYSIGLGNVWRFPYLVYQNGGGVFLIPFIIMMLLCGLPLLFLELALGQFAALGPVVIYDYFCPLIQGLGYAMILVSFSVGLYYNVIIAWTLYYIVASFTSKLAWEQCDGSWMTNNCMTANEAITCSKINGTFYNRTCFNYTMAQEYNLSALIEENPRKTPSEEFFNNQVLGLTSGIDDITGIQWPIVVALFVAWAIICLCLCKGVKSSGKAAYFVALFPYVVLITLFVRGVTLDGAKDGILFYITPEWHLLTQASVWGDAAVQVFFALSPAWGGLLTLASYNKFNNNCFKDAVVVCVCSVLTSVFAGFVIFAIIGYLANEMGSTVEKVVKQGTGLAFIVFPEAVTKLPVSPLWSFLFFFMLLTLGLGSQNALLETLQTAVLDTFPQLRKKRVIVLCSICTVCFFGGLIYTTNAGLYWLDLCDKFAASFSVLLIALVEVIYFAWIYGAKRFLKDIQTMIGNRSETFVKFWMLTWQFATPSTLVFILVFNWIQYKPTTSGSYVYPAWANVFGWCLAFFPITVFVLTVVYKVMNNDTKGTMMDKMRNLCKPKYILRRRESVYSKEELNDIALMKT